MRIMKTYSAVMTTSEITSTLNMFLCLKWYSAAEWDTLSKPMKAQGEMKAMRRTCRRASLSGMKAGAMVWPEPRKPSMAPTKQTVMPRVNTSVRISMQRAVAFLLPMHSAATSTITSSVTSASPRYTS